MTDAGAPKLLDRDAYRRLLVRRDGLAAALLLVRVVFHVTLLAGANLLFASGHVIAAILLLIPHFLTWSFLGWAGIGHELFHNSVFSARWLNRLLFVVFSVLTWNNYGYFDVTHPAHHRRTLGEDDLEASPQARLIAALWRRLRILVLNATGVAPGNAMARVFPPDSDELRQLKTGARAVLAGQALLIAACLALGSPFLALAISLAPFCLTFPNRTLAALQHFNLAADETEGVYEASTRTLVLDPVTGFFYADMNYHLEHHHFPAIPHYNLRGVHDVFSRGGKHRHIERGYWNGLKLLARNGFFTGGKTPRQP